MCSEIEKYIYRCYEQNLNIGILISVRFANGKETAGGLARNHSKAGPYRYRSTTFNDIRMSCKKTVHINTMERLLSIIQIIAYLFLKDVLSLRIVDVFQLPENQKIDVLYNMMAKINPQSASILQFNDAERNDICKDLLNSDLILNMGMSPVTENTYDSVYYVDIKQFYVNGVRHNSIALVCVGHKIEQNEISTEHEFLVIYGYRETYFLVIYLNESKKSNFLAIIRTVPKYKNWDQQTLEEYFIRIWTTIKKVKRLSPEISRKIEKQNILNKIQENPNLMEYICTSVLKTKFYRVKTVEFMWGQEDNVSLDQKDPQSASILQFNDAERNDICQDLMDSDLIRNMGISPVDENTYDSAYYVDIKQFYVNGVRHNSIALVCVGRKMAQNEIFIKREFLISYAFEENLFFVIHLNEFKRGNFLAVLRTLPKYMNWDQQTLEEYFLKIWNTTEKLKKLSSDIEQKLEEQNIISQIQDDENLMDFICASVLKTKFYKLKSVEFKWRQEDNVSFDTNGKWLSFRTSKYKNVLKFIHGCMCKAYENDVPQNYYVSWSFVDDRSIFVQKIENQFNFLELFVYDIPINCSSKVIHVSSRKSKDFPDSFSRLANGVPNSAFILTYDELERNQICEDTFESRLFKNEVIYHSNDTKEKLQAKLKKMYYKYEDEQLYSELFNKINGGPSHYLSVEKQETYDEKHIGIALICKGIEITEDGEINFKIVIIINGHNENTLLIFGSESHFLAMAHPLPTFKYVDKDDITNNYVEVRKLVDELIKKSDSAEQEFRDTIIGNIVNYVDEEEVMKDLCSSVFESDFYKTKLITFNPEDGGNYSSDVNEITIKTQNDPLVTYKDDSIQCNVQVENKSEPETFNLLWSYVDNESMYIGKQEYDHVILDSYAKFVPVLKYCDERSDNVIN
ncbi:hypothetical protein PGB90_006587 [Kerria lacca]